MSPSPSPTPLPLPDPPPPREDKEDKEESTTLPAGKGLRTAVALSTASCFCCSGLWTRGTGESPPSSRVSPNRVTSYESSAPHCGNGVGKEIRVFLAIPHFFLEQSRVGAFDAINISPKKDSPQDQERSWVFPFYSKKSTSCARFEESTNQPGFDTRGSCKHVRHFVPLQRLYSKYKNQQLFRAGGGAKGG